MPFIVQKAFDVHFRRMRGQFATLAVALVLCAAMLTPNSAYARESEHGEQNETLNCTDPKHRHSIVRSLTESLPIRKKDKARVRRVLM
jgi:hypothetical protein